MTPEIDIIIPVWNQPELTVACLRSIREHTPEAYRIVLVDNGSEPEAFAAVDAELQNHPHLLIRNQTNLGFVKATNRGICASDAPLLVIMNNDTEAAPGWIAKLTAPLAIPMVAAVGPLTTTPHSWQGQWAGRGGWVVLGPDAMLAFFCVLIRRRAVDQIGLLDEDYGIGFADDDDYCSRLHEAGWRLALAQDLVIPHHHRTSFRQRFTDDEISEMQDASRAAAKPIPRRVQIRTDLSEYPDGLDDRLLWLASLLQTCPELPGFVLEADPWSVATLVMLADIGNARLPTIVPVFDGRPGGAAALPGRPRVGQGAAQRYLERVRLDLSAGCVAHLEVGRAGAERTLMTNPGLPMTLLVGRWPAPRTPSQAEIDVGRGLMSAVHDVPYAVIRDFLSDRGIALPPGFEAFEGAEEEVIR